MLTGITTRTSTPQEDAELWPGGSAEPVLDYLTGTLGMTDAGARELLKAARTAQAETGPGTLADYPVAGRDAHLLIHYAPGRRAYRFKLTAPGKNEAPPGTNPVPGAPGNQPGPDGPPGGRETPDGSPAGNAGLAPVPERQAPPGRRRSRSLSGTTWPSMARGGIPPCWTATSPATLWSPSLPTRRTRAPAEGIADEAFAIFNDHPRDAAGAELARAYYGRRLRSLSFPGNSPCCIRSCCLHRRAVWPRSSSTPPGERMSCGRQSGTRRSHHDGQDLAAAGAAARPARKVRRG